MEIQGIKLKTHGIRWKSLKSEGKSIKSRRNPWNPMEIYRVPLKSYRSLVEILGILWEPKEIQWIFMEVQKSENN